MLRRAFLSFLVALAAFAATRPASGQAIRGVVREETTRQPIVRATVTLKTARDSVIAVAFTTDSGRFHFPAQVVGQYVLDIKRLGFAPIFTQPFPLRAADTLAITVDMVRAVHALDTVVSVETRGVFEMTPGREYVRRHFAMGIGIIISGWDIERTGLPLSEYLGNQAGVRLTQVWAPGMPVVPAADNRGLTSVLSSGCLYARVDRGSLLFKLITDAGRWIDEVLRTKDVMAVEIFLDKSEIPPEWAQEARAQDVYGRNFAGNRAPSRAATGTFGGSSTNDYLIGDTGFPRIMPQVLADDASSFGTTLVASAMQPGLPAPPATCGFMQIWTGIAW